MKSDNHNSIDALRVWIPQMPLTHFVTFNFNDGRTIESAIRAIKKWHAGVDRVLLGKHFNKYPLEQRTFFLAFFEHMDTNLHAHALVCCPYDDFNAIAKQTWDKIVPSGSLHISGDESDQRIHQFKPDLERLYHPIDTPEGKDIVINYVLKEQHKDENYSNFLLSSVFLPK